MQIPFLSGGSGTELNFEVVGGTTIPENPKKNTIWVNTEQEITGWSFALKEPTSPPDGYVWFKLNENENSITVNVLAKNEIQIHIDDAFIYSGETFVDLDVVKVYQSGEWKDLWNGVLFDHGIVPGGYCGLVSGAARSDYPAGTMTFGSDSWDFICQKGRSICLRTKEKIDISKYSTLKLIYSGDADGRFGLANQTYPYASGSTVAMEGFSKSLTNPALDISSYKDSGPYYIMFATYSNMEAGVSGKVHKLWLE